jgi:hypothetical protein
MEAAAAAAVAAALVRVDKCGRYCQGVEEEKRKRDRSPPLRLCKSDRTQYQSINQKEIDKSYGSRNSVCCIFERGMGGSLWPTSFFFPVPFSLFFSEIEVLMDGHPDRQVRSDMLSVPFATPVGEGGFKNLSFDYVLLREALLFNTG